MATDVKQYGDDYDLILEPYMQSDLADIEVYAEAVDRSHPQPLVGRSESLTFKSASAYGRYQQTLDTLRQLKTMIDDSSRDKKEPLDAKMVEIVNSAERQSETSPFFDGLDRSNISAFASEISNAVSSQNHDLASEVGERLNEFLFEHETIDDRERDRDYFIALRSYSRVIENANENRAGEISAIAERLQKFLTQRERRWKLRIDRIPSQHRPANASNILNDHPFHKDLQRVVQLMNSGDTLKSKDSPTRGDALTQLSKSSGAFRNWIETLEKSEDQARSAEDTKRQQNLAAARDELKELQQQQSIISQELDRAASRSKDEMHDNWSATRMKQNNNIEGTKRIEGQLKAMAPRAAERIALAKESMELTISSGGRDEFAEAESASDLAGRLLRQADSAAQRAQQSGGQRGRRRRVTGDQYYGNSLTGNDGDVAIQRQYEVDKKYRDLIIDDIQQTLYEERLQDTNEDREMVEQYLRQIVR